MPITFLALIIILGTAMSFGLAFYAFARYMRTQQTQPVVEQEMTRSEFNQLIASKEAEARTPLQEHIADLERTVAAQEAELVRLRSEPDSNT